ncbi:MAG: NMD3-related protein [Methanosarcinaceae archaeon]|nr:NMD3-related protein [Methanosarcinaceae archaeon]MDD4331995.1 NMD3-related protein [Methanosarcinaceae archaeon]
MNFIICPKCGKDCEKLFDKVCQTCFFENFKLLELPLVLHLRLCSRCGASYHKSRWEELGSLEDVVLKTVEEALFVHELAENLELSFEPRKLSPFIFKVQVGVDARVLGVPVFADAETEVRIKREACDMCSREAGGYFEALIQVRAEGRFPTEAEKKRCLQIARDVVRQLKKKGDRLAFITHELVFKEGLDFYMGSTNASKQVCRQIASELGGSYSESPSLVGMKDGKEVYRVTYSMRLPEFRPGDLVHFRGKVIEIKNSGKKIIGLDHSGGGTRYTAAAEEFKGAEKLGRIEDATLTVLVSIEEHAILVLDPESYETVAIRKPASFSAEAGSEIKVLKTPYGLFALPDSNFSRAQPKA